MKEDILEQIVDSWLMRKEATFTKHNVKFKPGFDHPDYHKNADAVHSDIDILAVHLGKKSQEKVSVVTCKSWQDGFNIKLYLDTLGIGENTKIAGGKEIWKHFRELSTDKWSDAFRKKILEETKSRDFKYYIAVTKVLHPELKSQFENNQVFLNRLTDFGKYKVSIHVIEFAEIWADIFSSLTGTIESTDIGRMLQLIKASGINNSNKETHKTNDQSGKNKKANEA